MKASFRRTVVTLVFIAGGCVDTIPLRDLTLTRMWILKRRVVRFALANGILPTDLGALPKLPGFDNELTDAWGGAILFTSEATGIVSFRSLGSDRAVGGTGDAEDIERRFRARTPSGGWADELADWSDTHE